MNPHNCKHFTGIRNQTCEIGIPYDPTALPCIGTVAQRTGASCARFELPTAAEVAADKAKIDAALAAVFAGRSPCCKALLTPTAKDGTGPRFCSACKRFVMRACRPREGR